MQILNIRPVPPGGAGKTIARFDIALDEHVKLFDLKLLERPDGSNYAFGPNTGGARVMSFSPTFSEEIARAASAALEGVAAYDRTTA
ncbi:hypothetical protein [Mesorhizobium huakuii]|uniref:Uncharacterized protein n=1 Tax=Mesorhizobium huakuii TaxID=28104 RepID=A0A7G6SZB0_9HYPH|nr:hypothetical protein [Mesorhizobium huakuii]QND59842.1 hypothetical protein HB778_27260 [Mesorhizobium huakuii]